MGEAQPGFTLLVVDDAEDILELVGHVLAADCLVKKATDGRSALKAAFEKPQPDLILLDVEMPGSNGYDVCRAIKATPAIADVPVIFLTNRDQAQDVVRGFQMGAIDYFTKPVIPSVLVARMRTHIELIRRRQRQEEVIMERSSQLEQTRLQLIRRLGRAMEYHESSAVGNRVVRLAHYARILSQAAGAKPAQCDLMMKAAPLHDIGKLGVPATILRKAEKLTVPEREQMQRHPEIGAEIIGTHDDPLLSLARTLALTHHERWDGTGYPSGAAGEAIPWPGRVMAIVDAFEGMTATQFHRDPIPVDIAAAEIVRGAGKLFDPQVVDAFKKALPAFRDVHETYADALGDMLNLDFSAARPAAASASAPAPAPAPAPSPDPAVQERALQSMREADEARAKSLAAHQARVKVERELAAAAVKDLSTQQAARKRAEEAYARDAEIAELAKKRIAEETAAARFAQERTRAEAEAAQQARRAAQANVEAAAAAEARAKAEEATRIAAKEKREAEEARTKSAAALAQVQARALAAAKARAEEESAAMQATQQRERAEADAAQLLRQVEEQKTEKRRAEEALAEVARLGRELEQAQSALRDEKLRAEQEATEIQRLRQALEEEKGRAAEALREKRKTDETLAVLEEEKVRKEHQLAEIQRLGDALEEEKGRSHAAVDRAEKASANLEKALAELGRISAELEQERVRSREAAQSAAEEEKRRLAETAAKAEAALAEVARLGRELDQEKARSSTREQERSALSDEKARAEQAVAEIRRLGQALEEEKSRAAEAARLGRELEEERARSVEAAQRAEAQTRRLAEQLEQERARSREAAQSAADAGSLAQARASEIAELQAKLARQAHVAAAAKPQSARRSLVYLLLPLAAAAAMAWFYAQEQDEPAPKAVVPVAPAPAAKPAPVAAAPVAPPQPIALFADGAPLGLRLEHDFEKLAPRER